MNDKLSYWKDWVERNEAALGDQSNRMDEREALYRGEQREITPLTAKDRKKNGAYRKTAHLRNIIAENIESEVSGVIPMPKVTARRKSDEWRAKLLEDMLRNEMDRLPMETINDLVERMVPIQGGVYWLVEWDNDSSTHSTIGDVTVTALHPKQVIPQEGVFTKVEDMDAIAIKLPQTRSYIKRVYNKDVDEGEEDPSVRTLDEDAYTAEDMVTQIVVYYRNEKGGIGKFSWANDTILEDMEDFEARRTRQCQQCGEILSPDADRCPVCGSTQAREGEQAEEKVFKGFTTNNGTSIPGAVAGLDEAGLPLMQPTILPYYKPDIFPVFLQKNVSLFGRLLGDSDVDKIADQQNTINRMEQKILDRFIKAGTRVTLPDRADFRVDPEDSEKWYIGNPADAQLIGVYQFSGDLSQEMQYLAGVYEESRQALGITNSYQGRDDKTAESGIAKQFAAAQSAGRLESKRIMKEAAYAELYKRIVQLKVAYADEPRPIVAEDNRGQAKYEEFNRYDFYEQDEKGWHCILDDDRFLFSCDSNTPLANNRPQQWQEITSMYQMGAFGNPQELDSALLLWSELERLHYPNASDIREALEMKLQQQQMMLQQQQQQQMQLKQQLQQMQMDQQAQRAALEQARFQAERQDKQQARRDMERQAERDTDARAREDARADLMEMLSRRQRTM